jgi:hypothetical protein
MPANPLPTLYAVKHKPSGNTQVFPLLAGLTLGTQDGGDLVVTTDVSLRLGASGSSYTGTISTSAIRAALATGGKSPR